MPTPDQLRKLLELSPHPEGGAFRETFRSSLQVMHPAMGAPRAAGTAIYFLLEAGDFSAFHAVTSEETWHLYSGGPLELHIIHTNGIHEIAMLGMDLAAGERPQATVPAGALQAAIPAPGAGYCLCGCTVYPGFDFADFSLPPRAELIRIHPGHEAVIRRLTRD